MGHRMDSALGEIQASEPGELWRVHDRRCRGFAESRQSLLLGA